MRDNEYEDLLLQLVSNEVQRAAEADTEYASPKIQRRYGEVLIREMPRDLTAIALRNGNANTVSARLAHVRLQWRLLARWRRQIGPKIRPAPRTGGGRHR